jgi:2-polyprenyl-3-methyl-5-hydroxy-6-metoxy-1,4-benzoquinol methylase
MSITSAICRSYSNPLVKTYARIRFQILRQRFLDEIGQYLPEEGNILDVGCGFGLFSLYFAHTPGRRLCGFDLNGGRVAAARTAAGKLGLSNVEFHKGDARAIYRRDQVDAVFMLDIVHHVPPEDVVPLISQIAVMLRPGGVFLLKDVADRPMLKRWFTWILDKAMDYRTPVKYWSIDNLREALQSHFGSVHVHQMVDYLPYPHVLYICRKQ